MLRLVTLLTVVIGMTATLRADAPRRPALHWSRGAGASSCIDPHALALRVTAVTGPVLVAATEADVSIEGHITRMPNGSYEARVTATGRDGVSRGARSLRQAGDCRALDQALAFVIALLIDPDLVLERLPPELVALGAEGEASQARLLRELQAQPVPARPAAANSPSKSEAVPARPSARPKAASAPPAYQLHFGAALTQDELPRTSGGLYLGAVLVARSWLGLDLSLRGAIMPGPYDLDSKDDRPVGRRRQLQAQRFGATFMACPRYPWSNVFLELCVGPEVTLLRVRALGFSEDQIAYRAAFAVQIAAGLGVLLRGAWSLRSRARLHLLANDPSFSYEQQPDGKSLAFQVPRLAFGADLGAGYQF